MMRPRFLADLAPPSAGWAWSEILSRLAILCRRAATRLEHAAERAVFARARRRARKGRA
ncbi:MAG TPA: hypothetical protein VF017_15370 [Thermoanaerobaculia bacterium]|nr:hypothetical protein [Thermoanaerobaculia bacterium]